MRSLPCKIKSPKIKGSAAAEFCNSIRRKWPVGGGQFQVLTGHAEVVTSGLLPFHGDAHSDDAFCAAISQADTARAAGRDVLVVCADQEGRLVFDVDLAHEVKDLIGGDAQQILRNANREHPLDQRPAMSTANNRYFTPIANPAGPCLSAPCNYPSGTEDAAFNPIEPICANARPPRALVFVRGLDGPRSAYPSNPARGAIDESPVGAIVASLAALQTALSEQFGVQPLARFRLDLEPVSANDPSGGLTPCFRSDWRLET